MDKLRSFMKKYPLVYALLGFALLWTAIRILPKIPAGALTIGVNEIKAGLFVLLVYWLLSGRSRDLKPDFTGFSYGFRLVRYFYILLFVLAAVGIAAAVSALVKGEGTESILGNLFNSILICLAVGVVEEFTCRAMLFGGLVRLFRGTRKGVIWAAVISAFVFGFVHVANEVFTGQISDTAGVMQVIGKTVEAGLFGFVLAVVYFKTRSIWSVVAMHSLFDFLALIASLTGGGLSSYVKTDSVSGRAASIAYLVLSLLELPAVIRAWRELGKEPEPYVCPGDEDFTPRSLVYTKEKKNK